MQVQQRVAGSYCGNTFSGVITAMRPLTVKTDGCFEFSVDLDEPMSVFGAERSHLLVHAKFDGQPSSYTKFDDHLIAAAARA